MTIFPVTMKILLLLCHPQPGSFNHAVADRARQVLERLGHRVLFHDLYAEGFDPVLGAAELRRRFSFDETVLRQARELAEADGLVVVHPDWWGGPPALLKGWLERVLRPGVGWEFEGEEHLPKTRVPLLGGLRAAVFCTSHEPEAADGTLLERFWRERVLGYCGVTDVTVRLLGDLRRREAGRRRDWLESVERTLAGLFPPRAAASAGPDPGVRSAPPEEPAT